MKTAITGGTGFIGAILTQRLLELGHEVALLCRTLEHKPFPSHPNLKIFKGDITDPEVTLDSFLLDAEVLFHCAGELRTSNKMYALHVEGTKRLIDAASGRISTWIQLSSVGAYGPQRGEKVSEETVGQPVGIYETTKAQSDELVISAAKRGAFQARILRPAIVIGEAMPNASVRQLIRVLDAGQFVFIGPKGSIVNYVAVENLVQAMLACTRPLASQVEVYNLADTCTLEDFVGALCRGLNSSPPRLRMPLIIAYAAAYLFQWLHWFPLTASRVTALANRTSYFSVKLQQQLEYHPVISIEAAASDIAAKWKRDNG